MPKGQSLSLPIRGAIIVLHVYSNLNFAQIADQLHLPHPETARRTYLRIKEKATSDTLVALLEAAAEGDKVRTEPGNPPKIRVGSIESERMKELALLDEEHLQKTFPEIAQEAGLDITDSTAYKIMHEHHNLFRYRRRSKPPLDEQGKQDRLELVDWGLDKPIESFVYSDEMIFEVGAPRGLRNITRPRGADPYAYAIHDKKPNGFSVMVSGCIALGYKGPLWVWIKETPEERQENAANLEEENQQKRRRIEQRRANARIPGTEEWQYIQDLNRQITEYMAHRQPGEPRWMLRRPEWEFGEEIRQRSEGGGMDWFLYRKHVLHERVYPFIERIQLETGRHCWLIEDNAGNHTVAAKVDRWEAERRGIRCVPKWPANSPDINEIEPCWNYLKDSMAEYEFIGSGQDTRNEVERALLFEWDRMPQELIDRFCMNIHLNLQQVRAWGGDNKFNA